MMGREATGLEVIVKTTGPLPQDRVMLCATCRSIVTSIDMHLLVGCLPPTSPARVRTEE